MRSKEEEDVYSKEHFTYYKLPVCLAICAWECENAVSIGETSREMCLCGRPSRESQMTKTDTGSEISSYIKTKRDILFKENTYTTLE